MPKSSRKMMKDHIIRMAPSKCKVCPKCGTENSQERSHCSFCDSPFGDQTFRSASASEVTQFLPQSVSTDPLAPGSILARRYLIDRKLGSGGMGSVFKAVDLDTGEHIAIKMVRPELMLSSASLSRFKRELVMTHAITHPNVVRTYDLISDRDLKFITMAFIEGQSLAELLSGPEIPIFQAVDIVRQICDGLEAAHSQGIVHRDLKPQNIMIEPAGRALIMDFGLAHHEAAPDVTQDGTFIGTPDYSSPEQVRGLEVDCRSDIFSLGIILYELLTGTLPFARALNPVAIAERCSKRPKAPSQVNPRVPKALDRVVLKCLECDRDKRYESAREFKHDLLTWDGAGAAVSAVVRRWLRLWPIPAAAAVLLVIAGVWLFRGAETPPPASTSPVRVLVADLANNTGDSLFDGALEPLITIALEESRNVTCYDRATTHKLADAVHPGSHRLDAGTARLAAMRDGLNVVVDGSVSQDGAQYTLRLEAINAGTGRLLARETVKANDRQGLLGQIDRAVRPIRRALGDRGIIKTQFAQETFTANSLVSAHLYASAQEDQLAGRYEDALREYLAATQLDSRLGRAWAGAATIYLNLGNRAEADRLFRIALSQTGRMTDREKYRTRGGYYVAAGDYAHAIEEYSQLVREYPFDNAGHANLALAYFYNLDVNNALSEGRKAVEIYPKNTAQRNNLAWYALYAGDFVEAEREARQALQLNDKLEKGWVALALAEMALDRRNDALASWQKLQQISARGRSLAALGTADLAVMEARPKDAISVLAPSADEDLSSNRRIDAAVKHTIVAEAQLLDGNTKQAEAETAQALTISRDRLVAMAAARIYIKTGSQEKVRAIVGELKSNSALDAQIQARLIEGEMQLRQGRASNAIASFEGARKLGDSWLGRLDLARAYVKAGEFAQADSELDICMKRRGEALAVFLDDRPTLRYLAPMYYYVARAQEGLGSPAASDSYDLFLGLKTGTADPMINDAKKRLAALTRTKQ